MSLILTIIVLGAVGAVLFVFVQQVASGRSARLRAERYAIKVGYAVAKLHDAADTPGLDGLTRDSLRIQAREVSEFLTNVTNGGKDA
jgi:hypothetical protein